ncbi:MAG: class I adenylate-forming enzyme family protein, partial [Pseudomonadota bacterium]|nr:class I adenylate-forming enzyme family protein [Pseudomonadota bacterium]
MKNPSKIAYKHGKNTRTYSELTQRIDSISSLISSFGILSKSNIAIVASNSIEYMEIVLAASQLGHPIATVNPKLTIKEIVSICEDAQASLIFVDQKVSTLLEGIHIDGGQRKINIENELSNLIDQSSQMGGLPAIDEKETFTIPYTSGTTGKPKGVLVPHRSRALTLYGMADAYGCFSSDDRFLSIAPMCHGAGMIFSLAPIFFGGYAEIMDDFNPELVMKTIEEENITGFFGVPTHFYGMLGIDQSILDSCTGSSLKTIISNAAALPQSLKEKIVEHFGEGLLYECYG